MSEPRVQVVPDAETLARAAADRVTEIARAAIEAQGRVTIALSGGSTPRALFRLLSQEPWREWIDWERLYVFWGDERTVPPDDPESNYRMAHEELLARVPIPAGQIHRMRGEDDPSEAARSYEAVLREVFALAPGAWPRFDLILLGIGADGHTASLFPGTAALHETERLVVANEVPQLSTTRLTLTAPVITAAAQVLVLAAGADKADAVRRAIAGPRDLEETPSQLLRDARGEVTWLLDEAAAADLPEADDD